MNVVTLIGRAVKDPQVTYTQGDKPMAIASFNLAVNRKTKNAEGKYDADFINCKAFGKTAELVEKYITKGSQMGITGHWQTGNYKNKDGNTVYTNECVVDSFDFVGAKVDKPASNNDGQGFMQIPEGMDADLPFR